MPSTPRKVFVNLPVENLDKTVDFFTRLGFEFNPQFTDENATCMVLGEDAYVMFLVRDFFKSFVTGKEICDSAAQVEVAVAISAVDRAEVDDLVGKALAAGGATANEPQDHGFMYGSSFYDLDGHLWEVVWMDPAHVEQ